jgi:hypothetical protein
MPCLNIRGDADEPTVHIWRLGLDVLYKIWESVLLEIILYSSCIECVASF